jgi:hypothetical protein
LNCVSVYACPDAGWAVTNSVGCRDGSVRGFWMVNVSVLGFWMVNVSVLGAGANAVPQTVQNLSPVRSCLHVVQNFIA